MKTNLKPFMSCDWTNLVYINYQVDADIINQLLPKDLEVDLFNGKAMLSFVCFQFSKARFFGVKIPFHQSFPEINLRTYVKRISKPDEKGIYFISEMAPKLMTCLVAKWIFGEPFSCLPVRSSFNDNGFNYSIHSRKCCIEVKCQQNFNANDIEKSNEQFFVIDRVFAFCGKAKRKFLKYEVQHQEWSLIPLVISYFKLDSIKHIPNQLQSAIANIEPCSIFATDGSSVNVFKVAS